MINMFDNIRKKSSIEISLNQKISRAILIGILGSTVGFFSKYFDGTTLGTIGSEESFWILTITLISIYSRNPITAVIHTFVYLITMITTYYITFLYLFNFFPQSYFLLWSLVAIFIAMGSFIIWFAKGKGWFSAILSALPISLNLIMGSYIYINIKYTHESIIPPLFRLISALILFIILSSKGQRLKVLSLVIIFYFIIKKLHLISYLNMLLMELV